MRNVVRLGTWVMLAMMTQFFVNYFDSLMVGRLDTVTATASQAALGLGMPIFWAVGGFFAAVGIGTQAITGRRFVEGDSQRTGQVLWNSLCIAVFAGALGGAIGYFITPHTMDALAKASPQQLTLGTTYTQIRMLGVPGMVITFSYKSFYDGIGRTHVHLWAAVAMNVFNIGLNYFLIYGNDTLGIPRLELAGAGIASVLSTYIGLAIMIGYSLRRADRQRFRFYQREHTDFGIILRIGKLMLPSGFATVILMAGFAMFMGFVGDIDAQAEATRANVFSAATKAIMDTAALCFMPLIAFGTATATCVSQSLGAGKRNLAARYGWEASRLGVYAMIVVAIVFCVIPEPIIAILAHNDPAVPAAAKTSLRIVALSLPLMAMGLILSQALYGAGANVFVAVVELVLHFGFLVPVSWLLGPRLGFGMEGVWSAAAMYIALLGVTMILKFRSHGWRQIRL